MSELVRQLQFCHRREDCDGTPIPYSLFLTSNYELLVLAHCKGCGGEFQAEIPLERLIVSCPGIASLDGAMILFDDVVEMGNGTAATASTLPDGRS
jgi:hypothetical protein